MASTVGRRNVPEIIAVLAALILLVDVVVYRPAQARMQRAERAATDLGFSFDPSSRRVLLPIQVSSFVMDNSMAEDEAEVAGRTGMLAADLLDQMTRLASQSGLAVIATEPGLTLQQPTEVLVRARLKARGSYPAFLRYMTALGNGEHLVTVDRFSIAANEGGDANIELWVTRHVIKRVPQRKHA
jgi:hypothetical protein